MLNASELRALYNQYQRRHDGDPRIRREIVGGVVRYVPLIEFQGFVLDSDLTTETADAAIAAQIDYYRTLDLSFEWKLMDYDQPPDLGARLQAHGLIAEDPEAVMVLDIAQAAPHLQQPPTFDIRKITEAAQLADGDAINAVVWGNRGQLSEWVLSAWEVDPDSLNLFIAYVDDVPVSYGRLEFGMDANNPFASIWAGCTLPEYRNRGIYSQLIAARLQAAQARGRRYLQVDANPHTSMPILAKLGFVTIGIATPYIWEPAEKETTS